MGNQKLENIEAIAFFCIITFNGIIFSTSKIIFNDSISGSLINTVLITILACLVVLAYSFLLKKFSGKNLLDVSDYLGGKFLKFFIGMSFIIYFTVRASIFLKKISSCLEIVYYPMTNIIFIVLLFIIATGIICQFKNISVCKTAVFMLPILFSLVVLIFIGNSKNFSFENLYPLLGNDIKTTFFTGLSNLFAFSGIAYLLFLPSKLKNPKSFTKISLISVILSGVFLFIALGNILFLYYDTIGNSELFPLYLCVRYIEFGTFFQRLDAVFLSLCIIGAISFLTLNTYLVVDILKNITSLSDNRPLVYPYLLIIFAVALSIKQNSTLEFMENIVSKILFFTIVILFSFVVLILANVKKKVKGGSN